MVQFRANQKIEFNSSGDRLSGCFASDMSTTLTNVRRMTPRCNFLYRFPASFITVEHQDHFREFGEHIFLPFESDDPMRATTEGYPAWCTLTAWKKPSTTMTILRPGTASID
jgi:hypothetical protein